MAVWIYIIPTYVLVGQHQTDEVAVGVCTLQYDIIGNGDVSRYANSGRWYQITAQPFSYQDILPNLIQCNAAAFGDGVIESPLHV